MSDPVDCPFIGVGRYANSFTIGSSRLDFLYGHGPFSPFSFGEAEGIAYGECMVRMIAPHNRSVAVRGGLHARKRVVF